MKAMKGIVRVALFALLPGVACGAAKTVNVADATELADAFTNATSETIVHLTNTALRVYQLSGQLTSGTAKVHLLGATDNPEDTVIRGSGSHRLFFIGGQGGTFRNLTFEDGNSGSSDSGVFHCTRSSPGTVSNCVFRNNKAENGAVAESGIGTNRRFDFIDCVFSNNTATVSGGVIYNAGKLTHCLFADNSATGAKSYGGAVYNALSIKDCTFTNNVSAVSGGAVYLSTTSTVSGCTFVDNRAVSLGSAVDVAENAATADSVFLTNCTFRANGLKASGNELKGTVASAPKVVDCRFFDNTAANGGAVYGSNLILCTFTNNTATFSGGAAYGSTLVDCAFSNNTAAATTTKSSYGGGAAHSSILTNCTLFGNTAYSGGAAHSSTLQGCLCEGNTATYAAGGVYECTMNSCTNRANVNTTTGTTKKRNGSEVTGGCATDCLFENFGVSGKAAFGGGAYDRCRFVSCTNGYLFSKSFYLTNCLITACSTWSSLFCYNNADATIVNTTVVSNDFKQFCDGSFGKIVVENSFFYGNTMHNQNFDIDNVATNGVSAFNNCIFSTPNADYAPGTDNLNYYENKSFRPGFVGAAASPRDPYALRRSSPAVKKAGAVADWMSDATDLRGEGYPRLRDGRVNIGCYQCWLDPAGILLYIK